MIYSVNKRTREHRIVARLDVLSNADWRYVEADAGGWIPWDARPASYQAPLPDGQACWVRLTDGSRYEIDDPETWDWSLGGDQWIKDYRPILDAKTETTEWDGGLPPVGCECELLRGKEWVPVEITGKGRRVTVFRRLCNAGLEEITEADASEFRPIRSEEDRAVEELQKAIVDYSNNALFDDEPLMLAEALYRAGYRKIATADGEDT